MIHHRLGRAAATAAAALALAVVPPAAASARAAEPLPASSPSAGMQDAPAPRPTLDGMTRLRTGVESLRQALEKKLAELQNSAFADKLRGIQRNAD
ncbi:hypothetical protein [Actinomadura parmotrematis]|uniref:Glycoside hydrolase n=1 Tax=Actinomadura parmotrematis TaxID=2864039 RepID=A0ABS7FV22_9ACTN|nr:hypothetical protein [Actinomadura parmotrematis]MBW8483810.1 hypothetical protein [Actinomadura parmotrematis]